MSTSVVEKATLTNLEEVLGLFDGVQAWLVKQGLKEQWGDQPFSENEAQRRRFAAWLDAGNFWVVRQDRQIVGTLVFSPMPPEYARDTCAGRTVGGYLEAFAVCRDYAGQGVGAALLVWAEQEAIRRGLERLYLDCWAENLVLRNYYRRTGFREVGTLTLGAWRGTLFEKVLKPPRLSLGQKRF
jgi:GNAT superfamily N-acetyltransferase